MITFKADMDEVDEMCVALGIEKEEYGCTGEFRLLVKSSTPGMMGEVVGAYRSATKEGAFIPSYINREKGVKVP